MSNKTTLGYTITITEHVIEDVIKEPQWAVIGKKFDEKLKEAVDERGYTPEITVRAKVDHQIYTQTVETLAIVSVIEAVNGITGL